MFQMNSVSNARELRYGLNPREGRENFTVTRSLGTGRVTLVT